MDLSSTARAGGRQQPARRPGIVGVVAALVAVMLVYVNTLIIQRVLSEKLWRNRMNAADLRALSTLIYSHVNPYANLNMSKWLLIETDFMLAA